ncbi:MAG: GNAT family N-acetyltransferase [Acidimicrobiia bacterium]|nr:GNAT family N-acetyltransferase [Acidimicrobiia bacterium]
MTVELRPPEPDELVAWRQALMLGFGASASAATAEAAIAQFDPQRCLVGFDDGQVVATSGNLTSALALPGGRAIPMAGVTSVSVRATHRRRGLLSRMMGHLLDDAVERGEALAALVASEAPIYGRFGFGEAVFADEVVIDRPLARFAPPLEPTGTICLEEAAGVVGDLMGLWQRWWPTCPGEVDRSEAWWQARIAVDPPGQRGGASARLAALHRGPGGGLDGYALYRAHPRWGQGNRPDGWVEVEALVALTPEARMELWSYLLGVDLVSEVRAQAVPLDEPLRHRLADLRQLRVEGRSDKLWVRLLDVPTALEARAYRAPGQLTIEVLDDVRPETAGRYRVDAGPDGAGVSRAAATTPADLVLGVAELGALYLGGVRASSLVAAGRAREAKSGAALVADRLFAGDGQPFCATIF